MNMLLRFSLVAGLAWAGAVLAAAPVANDDSYQTGQGQVFSVSAPGVLGNDTDADMDTLTAAKVSDPMFGTLSLAADGSFVYSPDAGYYGTDSFSYSASDGGASSQAVVTVTVTSAYAEGGGGGGGYGYGGALSLGALLLLALARLIRAA